jgi:O-methyltransferase involved in polyketide biosynthesis
MNEVNRTLFIPLYGKARVSQKGILLSDPTAEEIWEAEAFPIRGKSKSKWLAYNMAMRARVFDDWTEEMLREYPDALVLHIGCGLDSRCRRVKVPYRLWFDCDFPEVLAIRRKYFPESEIYRMIPLDAAKPEQIAALPDYGTAVVVLEGLTMYLPPDDLRGFCAALADKYPQVHILADFYTEFGAKASKYKNPVNDVGVRKLYGVDDPDALLDGLPVGVVREHSFTPASLVDELKPAERRVFRFLFTGRVYRKIYRLYELAAPCGTERKELS